MPSLAQALNAPKISDFEGHEVAQATIAIRKAGDGLSEALGFNTLGESEFHHGQEVFVVLKCRVADVQHPELKGTQYLVRKHIFVTEEATIVDGKIVKKQLDKQRDLIERAREEADGIQRLPGTSDSDANEDEDPEED